MIAYEFLDHARCIWTQNSYLIIQVKAYIVSNSTRDVASQYLWARLEHIWHIDVKNALPQWRHYFVIYSFSYGFDFTEVV